MKLFGALFAAVFLQIACGADDQHKAPEPLFEVFSPRGLRISIPDSNGVRSVQFTVNLPNCPQPLVQEVNHTDGNRWTFWDPEVALQVNDKLRYKLTIQKRDSYLKKEGAHVVQRVEPLKYDVDCTENQGHKVISKVSGGSEVNREILTAGVAPSYRASYSMQKGSELKPITKSSMSTTSGTFFIRPSGVMEATGYKEQSSFDSTKREGEQWHHSQSELTAEELENMKNLYGSGFHDFYQMHGGLFPSSGKVYQKSYMSSESKTFPAHTIRYGEVQPLTTHTFQETRKTHESSSYSNSKPVFQFSNTGGSTFEANSKAEKLKEGVYGGLPNPLPPQGTIFKATEYIRQEHTAPEVAQVRQTHVEAPQKIIQVSQTEELSSRNQEIVKPSFTPITPITTSRRADQLEYNSGNLQTVERQDYRDRTYLGNIFTTVKMSKVRSPQECTLIPGVDYTSNGSLSHLENYVFELSCLATLAESTMKEEIALLKRQNVDLIRKLELLEQEVKRISNTCNCYE